MAAEVSDDEKGGVAGHTQGPTLFETLQAVGDPIEKELKLLGRRYKNLKRTGDNTFQLTFEPTDQDFRFELEAGILLAFELSNHYPKFPCHVQASCAEVPGTILRLFEKGMREFSKVVKGRPYLRKLLRWLDNSIVALCQLGDEVRRKKAAEAMERHGVDAGVLGVEVEKSTDASGGDCDRKSDGGGDEDVTEADAQFPPWMSEEEKNEAREAMGLKPVRSKNASPKKEQERHIGTQILFRDTNLKEIAIFKPSRLQLQLQCGRCGAKRAEWIEPNVGTRLQCNKCNIFGVVRVRPCMGHAQSARIAYLDLDNLLCADVLPSDYMVSCYQCYADMTLRSCRAGRLATLNCKACHTALSFYFDGFEVSKISDSTVEAEAAKSRKKKQKGPLLRVGQPLPKNGACSHYKQSFRWFRYDCCDMLHPCEKCHDKEAKASSNPHKCQYASRQVCGKCSKEQSGNNTQCANPKCHFLFTKAKSTHWDGGTGCRDQKRMSKNDSRKHKGLSKTVSNKAKAKGKAGKKKGK